MIEVTETLQRVDRRVCEVLSDLEADWAALSAGVVDILAGNDLPALGRQASLGGKRFRPQMVHWGWAAAGAPPHRFEAVVDLGAALELLHVFALIHDDVMDRSETRRGRPSIHAVARAAHVRAHGRGEAARFGDDIAILTGDLLHAQADHLVSGLPERVRAVWRTMMIELVLGQCRDLTGAADGVPDLERATQVSRLKSGAYTVQRPLQMGTVLAGADDAVVDCLMRYGALVGEAFALRDDLLGTWGDPEVTGKPDLDDLETGKGTVLLALAATRLDAEQQDLARRCGTGTLNPQQLCGLRDAMRQAGIPEEVESRIARDVDEAVAALDPSLIAPEGIEGLAGLARQVSWRNT